MVRAIRVVLFIVMFGLAVGPGLPTGVLAGAQDSEKQKLTELIKAQMLLSQGEHDKYHEALEKLAQKYPNDADIKNLAQVHHETMHERMQAEEALRQEMMRRQIISSANGD